MGGDPQRPQCRRQGHRRWSVVSHRQGCRQSAGRSLMTLPELSIRRHVLAFMFSAVIVLFGLIAYLRIGIDRFPDVELPMLTVTTALPGASPEVIDQSITNVLESSLNGVPGINHIASSSSPGASVILIMFEVEK